MSLSGLAVALLLIGSLLLAHFSVRARPMTRARPLGVDTGLPLPEAGQASTVFSLTALFGAYFGIFIVLGIPALAGIACGTVLSLFVIRYWIQVANPATFEDFLLHVFNSGSRNGDVLALLISIVQCSFAASELLILREISRVLLGLQPHQATLVAVSIGLTGYFYVLFGGYVAIFRTDILQLFFVTVMTLAFSAYAISAGLTDVLEKLWPRPGYWELPFGVFDLAAVTYFYQFMVGVLMGFAFLAAAPDTWKRVFIVTRIRTTSNQRFGLFIAVGLIPFVMLLPVVFTVPPIPNGILDTSRIYMNISVNAPMFVVAALGLAATFLSSFNSAMIVSAHLGLILGRKHKRVPIEVGRYNILLVTVLLALFSIFEGFLKFGNPYLLGNVLLGPYTLIAGIQAGTAASPGRLPEHAVLWIAVVTMGFWILYLAETLGIPRAPTTYQFNTVPVGVAILPAVFIVCVLCIYLSKRK